MPYPYLTEQQSLARRRAMAQALQQQSFEPIEAPNYPGAQTSPWQGVAKMVQALMAGVANRRLDQQQLGLETKIKGERGAMVQALLGSPSTTQYQDVSTPGGTSQVSLPPNTPALASAFASGDPILQQMAAAVTSGGAKQEEEKRARAFEFEKMRYGHELNAPLTQAQISHLGAETTALGQPKYMGVGQGGAVFNEQTGQPVFTNPAKPTGPTSPKANFSNNGVPYSVTKGEQEWTLGDPTMPPDVKAVGEAAIASHKQRLQEGADIEERKAARQSERDDALAKLRNANAPDQIKTQVSAAYSTKDMIDVVRDIVRRKPQLVGPAVGRLEQKAQGIGTSFGLQNPEDERDASTLNGHLAYLFANELRAAFPNRPNKEVISELKKASAQIQQNPNILEGMLRSAENNANIAIQGGQRWGINIGNTPASPAGGSSGKRIKFGDLPR